MKQLMVLALACAAGGVAVAQETHVKVQYDVVRPNVSPFNESDSIKKEKMILMSGADGSKYYNPMSQYVDSLTSTPEGKKRLQEIQMAAWVTKGPDGSITVNKSKGNAPDKRIYLYVTKDFKKGELTVFDRMSDGLVTYKEPLNDMEWSVNGDSVRTVLGYECVLAVSDYHGRKWKAWFTPEIPVSDGPWKFRNLPGLVLLAEAEGAPFRFEATGLESVKEELPPMYKEGDYSGVERKKALKDEEYNITHMRSRLAAQRIKIATVMKDGTPMKETPYEKEKHAIETDY